MSGNNYTSKLVNHVYSSICSKNCMSWMQLYSVFKVAKILTEVNELEMSLRLKESKSSGSDRVP
jgi:hypothetical protein